MIFCNVYVTFRLHQSYLEEIKNALIKNQNYTSLQKKENRMKSEKATKLYTQVEQDIERLNVGESKEYKSPEYDATEIMVIKEIIDYFTNENKNIEAPKNQASMIAKFIKIK